MRLYLIGHDYRYAVEQMMLTLFPGQHPEYPGGPPDGTGPALLLSLAETEGALEARAGCGGKAMRIPACAGRTRGSLPAA